MAKATAQYKEVVRPVEKVTLEINQDEAITLLNILARVGGCPTHSPRKHADSIYIALGDVIGMDYMSLKNTKEGKAMTKSDERMGRRNNLIFDDYDKE